MIWHVLLHIIRKYWRVLQRDHAETICCVCMTLVSLVSVLAIVFSGISLPVHAGPPPFPDMAKSWFGYQDAVSYLVQKGSINGYPDGLFHPQETINRAEFLKLVFRSRGAVEPVAGNCFDDVPEDAWFAPFVCAAKRRGIVQGYETGTGSVFKPSQPVVFAEAIKMALKAYGGEVKEVVGEKWYEAYALELDRSGILSRHSYIPWDPLTRERAADLIARFILHEEDRVIMSRSPGCGKTLPAPPTSVPVNGVDRSFFLTVPRGYIAHEASPLIVAFHGRTNSNEQVRSYIGIDKAAQEFFVAYPAAIRSPQGSFSWNSTGDARDLAFFDALVYEVASRYCIDMDRIFVVGHSLGAWFGNSVACLRGGVVRASGTVGGSSLMTDCAGPSAAMLINNPHDEFSPSAAAELVRDIRLRENGCQAQSESVQPDALKCRLYKDCDGGNTVTWCPHELDHDPRGVYYPHNWPREAAPAIVQFFRTFER